MGISREVFHSAILADGLFWIWGEGDGGRLGSVHENPAFLPTLNPFLDSVRSFALGGICSVPSLPLARFLRGYYYIPPSISFHCNVFSFFKMILR